MVREIIVLCDVCCDQDPTGNLAARATQHTVGVAGGTWSLGLCTEHYGALVAPLAEVAERLGEAVKPAKPDPKAKPISGRPTKRFPGELRFFKKGAVDYADNEVHGRGRMVCPPDRVLSLVTDTRLHFFQFRDYDCSHTELKHRTYNDVLAKQRYDSGARFSWLRMTLHATKQFLDAYVRFGSWRYGMLGFMHSFYRWYMEVGIWFRIWEWEHRLSRDGVIQQNDAMRKRLEQEVAQFNGQLR